MAPPSAEEFATIPVNHRKFQQGYVGPPLRNVEVRMEGAGPSQIEVRGQAVGSGYHPEGDAENLRDGMFRPSDLLELDGRRLCDNRTDFGLDQCRRPEGESRKD